MNMEAIREYLPRYFEAFGLTLKIGWLGILISLVIGVTAAFILYSVLRRVRKNEK